MKKIITLLLLFVALSVQAQEEHMKFMGIPLDGKISQFQMKLSAKGVTPDDGIIDYKSLGSRRYKGSFAGKNATIFIYFDENTKVVYRAKAVITSYSEELNESEYNYFFNMLSKKYGDYADIKKDEHDNYESSIFLIYNKLTAEYKYLGNIDVYRSKSSYNNEYYLHIDYNDTINVVMHENNSMDDL